MERLHKSLRRVASFEFSPAFQGRDSIVIDSRRVATSEFTAISVVGTRRNRSPQTSRALKRPAKFKRRYASRRLDERFLKLVLHVMLFSLFIQSTVFALQTDTQVRTELEGVINQRSKAMERDDNATLISFYSPTFKIRLGGNKVLTLQDLSKGPSIDESRSERQHSAAIRSFKWNGTAAVLTVRHTDSLKQTLDDGSVREVFSGKHLLRSEKGNPVEVDITSGTIVFLALKLETGFPRGKGVLSLDNTALGAQAYKIPKMLDLNPLGSDNVDDASRVIEK